MAKPTKVVTVEKDFEGLVKLVSGAEVVYAHPTQVELWKQHGFKEEE